MCACVCVCVCVLRGCVRVCAHACAWVCFDEPSDGYCWRRNAEYPTVSSAFSFTFSFKKWCIFGGFYALMTLASQATVTIRGRGLCSCLLLWMWRLSIAVDAPFSFSLGGISLLVKGLMVAEVRKDSLQKKIVHLGLGSLRVAGKIIVNSNENMLGTHYATKCTRRCMEWNITPKVCERLPSVSSNHTSHSIKRWHYTYGTSTTHNQTTFSLSLHSHISRTQACTHAKPVV